jgi:circadian clock protein KaiC
LREFVISDQGIDLVDAYVGPGGVFTGSARVQQENREKGAVLAAEQELARRRAVLARKRQVAEAQVAALQAEIAGEEAELEALLALEQDKEKMVARERQQQANLRKADAPNPGKGA